MFIKERQDGDSAKLRAIARREKHAEQKDRLMAAALAIEGMQTSAIQTALSRSRGFVQRWVYAYRDRGIESLVAKPRGGSKGKVHGDALVRLQARIDEGPRAADKVCSLRGKDVQRIVKEELDTDVTLSSVYRTMHRMGYSCLMPRPRHEKQDLAAQKKFKEESAPFL